MTGDQQRRSIIAMSSRLFFEGEKFNAISHFVGVVLSLVGASVLITLSAQTGDPWKIVSASIYGALTIFLYTFSTLYHSFQGPIKSFFQKLDYVAIYLMIAGTYTPFTLVTLRRSYGWALFGVIWALAIFGIVQEIVRNSKKRRLSLAIYVAMGWLIVVTAAPLWQALSATSLVFLALGGIFYTSGIFFFVNDHKYKHFHGIWHLFVLFGSTSQYFSVLFALLSPGTAAQ